MTLPASSPLSVVLGLLRGDPVPASVDWDATIALANESWLVPALWGAITQAGRADDPALPDEARGYLRFIHARNAARNLKLRAQLEEALLRLAEADIRPLLSKGAIHLFTASDADLPRRMMGDLDLVVTEAERAEARRILMAAGHRLWSAPNEASDVLYRGSDAAPIELHSPQRGHAAYAALDRLAKPPVAHVRGVAVALIPDPAARLLHLVLHDQLRDGGLWRGAFELRHLVECDALIRAGGIDWAALRAAAAAPLERSAVAAQSELLEAFFGTRIPHAIGGFSGAVGRRLRRLRRGPGFTGDALRLWGKAAWVMRRSRLGEMSAVDALRRAAGIVVPPPPADTALLPLGVGPKTEPGRVGTPTFRVGAASRAVRDSE